MTLRLDGVRGISSLGVRALESFMVQLGEREVVLEDISAAVANQVTMIPNLLGRATVKSAKLPFVCPSCGTEEARSIPYQPSAATTHAPAVQRVRRQDGLRRLFRRIPTALVSRRN